MEIISISSATIAIGLLLFWLYMSIVKVVEDQYKLVYDLAGRYVRTISGVKGYRAATEEDVKQNPDLDLGEIIEGEDSGKFDFIPYGWHFIATYQMKKIVERVSSKLTESERSAILWGDPEKDHTVSVLQTSTSNHYRRQFTYEMVFEGLETGRTGPEHSAQNVKVRVKLNVTECSQNPYHTYSRESDGGKWLTTLHNVIMSSLGEIFSTKDANSISDLRALKLDAVPLKDGVSFIERVNQQMLKPVKNLGQATLDMDFVDYEIMEESKPFVEALSNAATAKIKKEASKDLADAEAILLRPEIDARKELLTAKKEAMKDLKITVDQTVVEQTKALPRGLKMFAGSLYSPSSGSTLNEEISLPDTKEIVSETIAHEIVDELNGNQGQKNKQKGKQR